MKFSANITLFAIISLISIGGALAAITVQIGNGLRISSGYQSRYRDTSMKCIWECDLVSCELSRYDDECAYDCDRVCRPRYDYLGRSGAGSDTSNAISASGKADLQVVGGDSELKPKSDVDPNSNMVETTGPTVRLYMPKNVTVAKFGIMERCSDQGGF